MLVCSGKTPYWVVIKRENWDQLWEYQKGLMQLKRIVMFTCFIALGSTPPRTLSKVAFLLTEFKIIAHVSPHKNSGKMHVYPEQIKTTIII